MITKLMAMMMRMMTVMMTRKSDVSHGDNIMMMMTSDADDG